MDYFSRYPVIPATLLGYSIAAPLSLRLWLAVSSLPLTHVPAADEAEGPKKRSKLRRLAHFATVFLVFAAIFGGEVYLLSKASESEQEATSIMAGLNGFFAFYFGAYAYFAFVSFLRAAPVSVHRHASNRLSFRPQWKRISIARGLVALGISAAASTAFYLTSSSTGTVAVVIQAGKKTLEITGAHGQLATGVLATAWISQTLARPPARTVSMRGVVITIVGGMALIMMLSGGMVALILSGQETVAPGSPDDLPNDLDLAANPLMRYVNLLVRCLWSAVPGFLITTAYRFDYSRHLSHSLALHAELVAVEPAAVMCAKSACAQRRLAKLSPGFEVPRRAPKGFRKPYFASLMAAWVLVQGFFFALDASELMPREISDQPGFAFLMLFLELPVMIIALVGTALIRRESRELWTYREVWALKKTRACGKACGRKAWWRRNKEQEGAIRLDGDESPAEAAKVLADTEENLPAYSVLPQDVKA